jgi:hypothetical protein
MRYFISLAFLCLTFNFSLAQNISDAVRYSVLEVGGTARTVGIGGAIGALGADFSVLSTNPAGLAAYRRSEFVFTPAWLRTSVDSRLDGAGTPREREKTNFNFNNLGIVFATRPLDSHWRTSVFGIGFNRLANFHQQIFFEGVSEGSITDRWLELANGLESDELDGFEAGLAFDGEAIFPNPDVARQYLSDFLPGDLVPKSQLIKRKGSINELVFSFAGNYDEKLMMGVTIGVPLLNYEETKTYRETDEGDDIPVFDELTYTERLKTTGAGINLKLGLIYRFNQMVRLGFAFHTPTSYGLDDSFSTSLNYVYTLDGFTPPGEVRSPEGSFDYRLRTPWRFIGSAGLIFEKAGFLSAEIEWLDYTNTRFNFNNTNSAADVEYEQELNDQIDNELNSALNIRLGGEFAYQIFRFRGGYSITATPYAEDDDPFGAFSLGAGIREENIFIDFAFRRQVTRGSYAPYFVDQSTQPNVITKENRGKFILTVGFKF